MALAQTHNTALKRLLAAEEGSIERVAVQYAALLAASEKENNLLRARADSLAVKVNEQEQLIASLRA